MPNRRSSDNDDGINRPAYGLAPASRLGFVHVVCRATSLALDMPSTSDGILTEQQVLIHGYVRAVYSVEALAQAVLHGILEIMPPA
jgi:hypothetical protein